MMAERAGAGRVTGWTIVNILVIVYALLPVLWILSLSLKPTSSVKDGKLIPSQITFDNYKGIFTGDAFSSALINSIGNLGGFLAPIVKNASDEAFGAAGGSYVLAAIALFGAILIGCSHFVSRGVRTIGERTEANAVVEEDAR